MREVTPTFEALHKDNSVAQKVISNLSAQLQEKGLMDWYIDQLRRMSSNEDKETYPAQNVTITRHEEENACVYDKLEFKDLPPELVEQFIHAWLYYLELFNHPERLEALYRQSDMVFQPPVAVNSPIFQEAAENKQAININDLKLTAGGADKPRQHRSKLHKEGTFVSYGRKLSFLERLRNTFLRTSYNEGRMQARNVIVGAANPEITGTPLALASLAQAHSLVCVPRDGYFSDIQRQVDLVKEAQEWLERSPVLINKEEDEKKILLDFWKHNLVGVLEAEPTKALQRAQALYEAGVRTFRIYSPEPSSSPLETLKALRKLEKEQGWEPIEIFVGQVVDVKQAVALEKAGANALYFGIGGGGRCITGVVAGLTIDWPELIWKLRGKVKIPCIVEGGANDNIPESLAVGVSGIGSAGKFGGTIETPGGYLFIFDTATGQLFKYYGGEASDRMRIMAGRDNPLGFVLNREGETRRKEVRNSGHYIPTLLQVLYEQQQGIVAGEVFQNVSSISEFQNVAAHNIKRASPHDDKSRSTH